MNAKSLLFGRGYLMLSVKVVT